MVRCLDVELVLSSDKLLVGGEGKLWVRPLLRGMPFDHTALVNQRRPSTVLAGGDGFHPSRSKFSQLVSVSVQWSTNDTAVVNLRWSQSTVLAVSFWP